MDAAGIDVQVLSEAEPGAQNLEPAQAVQLARVSNDLLHAAVRRHPERLAGFATLPTSDPAGAVRELLRAVNELGFRGAMVHGSSRGHFLDEPQLWPVLETAEGLDVPIYLHPCTPQPAVYDVYYKDHPALARASLGFTVEIAVQAMRLVVSGALDRFPRLKIILGHMGEALPYLAWRANDTLARTAKLPRGFREYLSAHFYVTTSGNFSLPALQCAIAELGAERIMFAVDWPFQPNRAAVDFVREAPLTADQRAGIFSGNAGRLLRI
jgi:2,3-dihydroxybenzoate decarboxylase